VTTTRCLKLMSSVFSEIYLANSISRYILDFGNILLVLLFIIVLELFVMSLTTWHVVILKSWILKWYKVTMMYFSLLLVGIGRVAMVRKTSGKIRLYSRSGKSQGVLYQIRVFWSLFKVSEKSGNFILRLPQIILLDVFV